MEKIFISAVFAWLFLLTVFWSKHELERELVIDRSKSLTSGIKDVYRFVIG